MHGARDNGGVFQPGRKDDAGGLYQKVRPLAPPEIALLHAYRKLTGEQAIRRAWPGLDTDGSNVKDFKRYGVFVTDIG
jgi:xanthosine utilization system XapX-like protein